MCGIVGLFLKNPTLEPRLGELAAPMLISMTGRGPDSAGFAIYRAEQAGELKLTLRGPEAALRALEAQLKMQLALPVSFMWRASHLVIKAREADVDTLRGAVAAHEAISVVASGAAMELYKDVGTPAEIAERFGLSGMVGSHIIGHTRMATESAVTTKGAHPFSTGDDQCLVHNGSLSNHNNLRRELNREGVLFETQNDSEVAAGYLTWRMRQGANLGQSLEASLADLDGFFTFVVGTRTGFGVVRDPIGCKPAIMAETDDWVAFGSEFRALVGLPGIESASIFEPEPAKVYFWERAA